MLTTPRLVVLFVLLHEVNVLSAVSIVYLGLKAIPSTLLQPVTTGSLMLFSPLCLPAVRTTKKFGVMLATVVIALKNMVNCINALIFMPVG